jgi:hypothetical protein
MIDISKAAPRPWVSGPTGSRMQGYGQTVAIVQLDNPRNLIAGVFGDQTGGEEAAQASAALIVRAVNSHDQLVEQLKELVSWTEGVCYQFGIGEDALAGARAAIAAAEGRS